MMPHNNAVLIIAVTVATAAAFQQHHKLVIQDATIQSWSCPFESRHLAQWDKVSDGFKRRNTDEVHTELPKGCTPDLHRTALTSVKSHVRVRSKEVTADSLRPSLIPYPKSLQLTKLGGFVVSRNTTVSFLHDASETSLKNAPFVAAAVSGLKKRMSKITSNAEQVASGVISLEIIQKDGADPASYNLTVTKTGIHLEAYGHVGFSYGITTLGQMMPFTAGSMQASNTIPSMVIEDAPTFQWRGLMLDVSRHFFDAAEVMKLLSVMAEYKLNSFHWHLTDDQGWRMPVPGYPKLLNNDGSNRTRSSGSYSEKDIRDVVAFAKARHIKIVPEIDVPGHVAAAVKAYPELGNSGNAPPSGSQFEWGVHEWTLAPTPATDKFLKAVFDQVSNLFPDSEYVHTGGDEAPQSQWDNASSDAMKSWDSIAGLRGGHKGGKVANYFNLKFREMIHSNGKKMAGWDEVQHVQGLPKDVGIFAWRSEDELLMAVRNGRHVINCNINVLYLDHAQTSGPEPENIGGLSPVDAVYNYQIVPDGVQDNQKHLIMGAQGQLWSEHFPDFKQVEYMAWPRGIALAENLWSSPSTSGLDFEDFKMRLEVRKKDLQDWKVNFHKLEERIQ